MATSERLAVIAAPGFRTPDRAWIDAIRRRYDPLHASVPPHVTLVFPFAGLTIEALTLHVRGAISGLQPITAVFRRLETFDDPLSGDSFLFLVPQEGGAALIELHDRLNVGSLAAFLQPDIPYAPHVTVGRLADAATAAAAMRECGPGGVEIIASIETLRLARLSGKAIETAGEIDLA